MERGIQFYSKLFTTKIKKMVRILIFALKGNKFQKITDFFESFSDAVVFHTKLLGRILVSSLHGRSMSMLPANKG